MLHSWFRCLVWLLCGIACDLLVVLFVWMGALLGGRMLFGFYGWLGCVSVFGFWCFELWFLLLLFCWLWITGGLF